MRNLCALIIVLTTAGAVSALGQQQAAQKTLPPTYQQTVDWILSKTNQLGESPKNVNGGTFSYAYSDISIRSCVLSYHVAYELGGFGYWDENVSIPMGSGISALDEGDASAGSWNVWLVSDTRSVHVRGTQYTDDGRINHFDEYKASSGGAADTSDWVFGEPNSDHKNISDRMVQAFTYLAGLCKAPAPKEPF